MTEHKPGDVDLIEERLISLADCYARPLELIHRKLAELYREYYREYEAAPPGTFKKLSAIERFSAIHRALDIVGEQIRRSQPAFDHDELLRDNERKRREAKSRVESAQHSDPEREG